jgi:hypothetical protein
MAQVQDGAGVSDGTSVKNLFDLTVSIATEAFRPENRSSHVPDVCESAKIARVGRLGDIAGTLPLEDRPIPCSHTEHPS